MAADLGILLSKYRNILKTRFNGIIITDDEHSIEERYLNGLTVFSNESDAQNALCWIKSVLLVNKLSETKGWTNILTVTYNAKLNAFFLSRDDGLIRDAFIAYDIDMPEDKYRKILEKDFNGFRAHLISENNSNRFSISTDEIFFITESDAKRALNWINSILLAKKLTKTEVK